ncbi:MAG: PQQ-binding-like beta-propeller repeat protein [Candidatus Acidiferrales bacterium]
MRYACLLAVLLTSVSARAQDGAAVYKAHCASCHDSGAARVPPKSALKAMSIPQVLAALENGPMKTVGDTLTPQERYAVTLYLSAAPPKAVPVPPSAFCATASGPFRFSSSAPGWRGWSPDAVNTRFQSAAAAELTAADVPKLKLKWAFGLGDETEARSAPGVANGRIFFGTQSGAVYSLDAHSGCIYWMTKMEGVRSALAIGPSEHGKRAAVYFGAGQNAYALDAATGKQLWKTRVADHFASFITAAPLLHKGALYFGVSSFEEAITPLPGYQCCTFRGSVVALKANTGKLLWRTYTIPDAPHATEKNKAGGQMYGPSGVAVWSTPTFDEKRKVIYVATGDNYSHPTTDTSDAVLALDAKTGKIVWSHQMTAGDAYTDACSIPGSPNCPPPAGNDFDFGQPPILVKLTNGKHVLVIAQKSGMAYGLDPEDKGTVLWQTRVGKGSSLGGSEWGSASDGENMYVAVSDVGFKGIVPDKSSAQGYRLLLNPDQGGGLFALSLASGEKVWSAAPAHVCGQRIGCSPAQSQAVSVIPGVVFSGSIDGHMRAYSTSDGKILWDVDTAHDYMTVNGQPAHGGSLDGPGPVIAGGMLFVSSGYGQFGGMPGNVLLAFSVDGR